MRIHREGYSTLALIGTVLLVFNLIITRGLPTRSRLFILGLSLVVQGFFTQFFRNPPRITPTCDKCIIAPADGTIVAIETVPENEFFCEPRLKLSIYMSALNVHVNRVPITGKVIYNQYHPGKYLVAFHPKASELNERNTVVIETPDGHQVLIRQIAGLLARRIRYYLVNNQPASVGKELGFIKFGSRCDIFLPTDSIIRVTMDQKVTGGETILATLPDTLPV